MVEHGIVQYGYLLLFAGTMVEGDAFLLAASFLAHRGRLHLPWVVAVATLATMTADQFYYHLARTRGQAAFAAKAAAEPRFARVRGWIERRGTVLLFLSRFMYGFRIAIPVACGAAGMPAARFALVNLLGSAVWAVSFGLAGYAFGSTLEIVIADVRHYEVLIAVLLFAAVAAVAGFRSRDLRRELDALRHPARETVHLAGHLFTAAHRAGRLVLERPHVRLAAFVVVVGLLDIATALFHWRFVALDVLDVWVPLELRSASRAALLVTGLALVAVGRGLGRRKRTAWTIASLAALASVPLHLGHHASVVRAGLSAWLLWQLLHHAHRFTARSDPARVRNALVAAPVLAAIVVAYGVAGYHQVHLGHHAIPAAMRMTWSAICLQPEPGPGTRAAILFGWSISGLTIAALAFVLGALLAPVAYRRESSAHARRAAEIAWKHGLDSLSYFAKQADKTHAMLGGDAFAAYRVVRGVAVVVGDPVGPAERVPDAIRRFVETCAHNDWVPVFYETSERWLATYAAAGLRSFKVGEEAVLPLQKFSLAGSKIAKVRHGVAKVEREAPGITVREYRADARDAEIDEQLEDISAEWLRGKGIGEMGFNLGVFSVADLDDKRTVIASTPDGMVWGFLTWVPYRGGHALLLDAMRRRPNGPASVIDLLIARSALLFKEEGIEEISLATAPLANVAVDEGTGLSPYDRGVRLIFEHFSTVYGYRSLFHFKKKFNPKWEGRYLVFPRPDQLPRIAYALTAVHIEGGLAGVVRQYIVSKMAGRRAAGEVEAKGAEAAPSRPSAGEAPAPEPGVGGRP